MAFSKRGSRRITVDQQLYLYKVGRIKKKSDWRPAGNGELDDSFLNIARHYGLGDVADATLTIAIQAKVDAASSMFVKFYSILVDGFMGSEQVLTVTPAVVASLIRHGLEKGWKPSEKGDVRIEIIEKRDNDHKPVLLLFPNTPSQLDNYENLIPLVEVNIDRPEDSP